MSRYLPEEIIANILSRLPAKSIQRFRCVCKSWLKLFNNPNFIRAHLKYANQRNTINFLIRGDDNCISLSRDIDSSSSKTCLEANEVDIPFQSPWHPTVCLGSCNGLVCLDVDDTVICFWNPTTNEYKEVSKPESFYSSKIKGNTRRVMLLSGLGYDSNNEDYKFVMISHTLGEGGYSISTEVNMYSLLSNSWKIIDYVISGYLLISAAGVYLNGVLHWGGNCVTYTETGTNVCHDILAFDILSETFSLEVGKPKDFGRDSLPRLVTGVLGDSLCVFFHFCGNERCLDVWVMKEYGVRESWTKLFTVVTNKLLGDESPSEVLHIFKKGEFLLEKVGDQKNLFLYDQEHNSARVLEIAGVPKWLGISTYLESLVSPNLSNSTGNEEG